tara:strand:+ start:181 stop:1263 length:1083 start_codon:yes stop_codon:yes gene_type:complete
MKNKTTIVIVTQIIIIFVLIWVVVLLVNKDTISNHSDDDESEEEIIVDYTTMVDGIKQIQLPGSVEKNSNIQFRKIEKTKTNQKKLNYGIVQDISALIKAKTNFVKVNYLITKLKNQVKNEKKHLEALIILNEDNKNISDLAINKKQTEISNLNNQINIYDYEKINILSLVKQQWGLKFIGILKNKNDPLNKLLKNENQLISLSVTQIDREKLPPENILIIPSISSSSEIKASYLSPSPRVNQSIVGKNFFYLTTNSKLIIGERISAYVLNSNKKQNFILVPNSSVVWSNGQPWAYIRIKENGNFVRRSLQGMGEAENGSENGWIVTDDKIKVDDEIVTNGAQLLLSEEFKYQIKNENED